MPHLVGGVTGMTLSHACHKRGCTRFEKGYHHSLRQLRGVADVCMAVVL